MRTGATRTLKQVVLEISTTSGRGQVGSFDTSVPLSGLTAGRYVLEISARMKSGRPVVREVPFEIR